MAKKDNQSKRSDPGKAKKTTKASQAKSKKKHWVKADYVKRAKEAGIENAEDFTVAEIKTKLSKLKQEGKLEDGRKNNGGDKKRGTIQLMESAQVQIADHAMEEIDVRILDEENPGQTKKVKMTRTQALMQKLFSEGLKGNVPAAREYLDRFLGKPKQAIELSGEIKTEEQKLPTPEEEAAAKAYQDALEKGLPVPSPLTR